MSFALPDNMPALSLTVPSHRQALVNVEMNEDLLKHWVKELPRDNPVALTAQYLDAITRFNQNQALPADRLRLLDIYRKPFNDLLFNLSADKLRKQVPDLTKRQQLIDDMATVFDELVKGYNSIITETNAQANNLKLHPIAHMAVYRGVEQLSYLALHAYKFYRTLPVNVLKQLYQLYVLTEAAKITDDIAFLNTTYKTDFSVKHRFIQLLLITVIDPYGLKSGDVLRAYHLMLQLAQNATLWLNKAPEIKAGLFFINCLSDRPPHPATRAIKSEEDDPLRLVLDTKAILVKVGEIFDQQERMQGSAKDNVALLKEVVPFLNTSYQRKQKRVPVEGEQHTFVTQGLQTTHQALSEKVTLPVKSHPWLNDSWQVLNKNHYGYLVQKRRAVLAQSLQVGDFIGIFDPTADGQQLTAKLASVRWIRHDQFEQTKMGLKFIEAESMPVSYTLQGHDQRYPAFLLPEQTHHHAPATLLTQKGVFKPGLILQIKIRKKKFGLTFKAQKLIEENANFERFSFEEVFDA